MTRPLEKDEARIPIVTGTRPLKKGEARFRWVTLLAELTFCFSCKLFATYVGKCRKSWLYRQGSSGRRQSSPYKQGLCKAKLPFFATSLHKSLSFHFSNGKKKATLDFRRLPGPVLILPGGMSAGSFSRTAAGNRA